MTSSAAVGELLFQGQNELYLRAGRTIQKSDGYYGDPPAFEGNPINFTCDTGINMETP
jgi:hypothetical protein